MRFIGALALASVVSCSPDTFTSGDGSTPDASSDAPSQLDAPGDAANADAAPPDPSSLGNKVVLWLESTDVVKSVTVGDAGESLGVSWPDHQHALTTNVMTNGSTTGCGSGLHVSQTAKGINNVPTVTFCNAYLSIADAPAIQLGSGPFLIEAVIRPGTPYGDSVLLTKTPTGDTLPLPQLTLLLPTAGDSVEGSINTTDSAMSANTLAAGPHYVGFFWRMSDNAMAIRVDGSQGTVTNPSTSDNVSAAGTPLQIGAYEYDVGIIDNVFPGDLAELVIVTDASVVTIGIIETYFKYKYAL